MRKPLIIKICLLFTIALVFSLILGQFVRSHFILPSYSKLEREYAQKDVGRSFEAIEHEIDHLKRITLNWAQRDEIYRFMQSRSDDFRMSSLSMEIVTETADIDIIFMLSDKREIIVDKVYDREKNFEISLPSFSAESFTDSQLFDELLAKNKEDISGVLLTPKGIIFLSSRPILPIDGRGKPNGILVMGRFLSQSIMKHLREETQLSLTIATPDFASFDEEYLSQLLSERGLLSESEDGLYISGRKAMLDIYNRPALIIDTQIPRHIYNQGLGISSFITLIITLSICSITAILTLFYLVFQNKKEKQAEEYRLLIKEKNDEISLATAQLNALSEAATEALMLVEDGYCIAMNSHTEEMFGYTLDEMYKHPTSELVIPEERKRIIELIQNFYEGFYETVGLRKDNSTFPLLVHGKAINLGNRNLRAVAIKDLTQQRQEEAERLILEDKVQRSERMESIGMLAGSVAHDLNNILSGVVTYPEFLLLKMDKDDPLRKPIEEIKKSGRKAAEVVEDLLTVARGIALLKTAVNLNSLIDAYLQSTEFRTVIDQHPKVSVNTDLEEGLPNIAGSPIHINKVIMNLFTNAIEAIDENIEGFVTISTRAEIVYDDNVDLKAGNYVSLEIRDSGMGITRGDLEHIFEPFYSRKIKGRSGTGLGLAIVWNVMQDHNGSVSVQSDREGTAFSLYFPVTDETLQENEDNVDISSIKGQQQTILVIDDNVQQLEIAKQILITLNYTVYTANSGEEALNFLKENRVDLLVLDMIMEPGLSGLETYKFAIKLQPDIKAIVASGFSVNEEVEQLQQLGAGSFLRKPYSIIEIGKAIKTILQK